MKITVQYNPWTLPGPPTYLEGKPSADELEHEKAKAAAARKVWKPGLEAFALLDQLREFVGSEVVIQGWDPIMFLLEDEGPCPIRATCVDVITREEGGHVRAYLAVKNPVDASPKGESSVLWQFVQDGDVWLFNLDKLYEITSAFSGCKETDAMSVSATNIAFELKELEHPLRWQLKGRLFAVRPKELRPRGVNSKKWATAIIKEAFKQNKAFMVIPSSLWKHKWGKVPVPSWIGNDDYTYFMDSFDGFDADGSLSPMYFMRDIIDQLNNGRDVYVLSEAGDLPIFISSIMTMIACDTHPVKVWNPIMCNYDDEKYVLSQFQLGYIYGVCDGVGSCFPGLSSVRSHLIPYKDDV